MDFFGMLKNCLLSFLVLSSISGSVIAGEESAEQALFDDMLSNYSSFLRPVKKNDYSTSIVVNAQFGIMQIESLNEREQYLTTHGYVSLVWKDHLISWNPASYGGAPYLLIVPAEKIWLPEITPINNVRGATELASLREDTRVRIYSDGTVVWIPALKWETSCSVDVSNFPYDSQYCEIMYANWMYTASLLNFTATERVETGGIIPNEEWTVTGSRSWVELMDNGDSSYVPLLKFSITLKRDPRFFELNVLLPAMLLAFLMVPMFALPVESGEKVSLGVTLMLAYSIFLLMMTDVTPRSGTTPRLTLVILVCTVFAGVSILLSVAVINIHHHCPKKPVPGWVKSLILGKLSHALCCMNYHSSNDIQPFDNEELNDITKIPVEKEKMPMGKDFSKDGIGDVIKHLQFFRESKIAEDRVGDNKDDWSKVARVLDRLLLCIYVMYALVTVLVVLILKYQ